MKEVSADRQCGHAEKRDEESDDLRKGRTQKTKQGRIYDYCACLYPEGMTTIHSSVYLFDQEDIGCIYYVGMQDSEEFRFRAKMEEELNRLSAPA